MARLIGHRQTKEAATDKPNLPPPRHIPTLPVLTVGGRLLNRHCKVRRFEPNGWFRAGHPAKIGRGCVISRRCWAQQSGIEFDWRGDCTGFGVRTCGQDRPGDCLGSQRRDQRSGSHDLHHSLEIVGEYVETHLGTDPSERAGEEVGGSHPGLQGSERIFGGLPADLHLPRVSVQASLHVDKHILVLPARHAPLRSWRAARFKGTRAAVRGPVAIQREAT